LMAVSSVATALCQYCEGEVFNLGFRWTSTIVSFMQLIDRHTALRSMLLYMLYNQNMVVKAKMRGKKKNFIRGISTC